MDKLFIWILGKLGQLVYKNLKKSCIFKSFSTLITISKIQFTASIFFGFDYFKLTSTNYDTSIIL